MRSTALTKTRIVVGTVMAAATIATTGMATSLALARTDQQADATVDQPDATQPASSAAKHRSASTTTSRSTTQNNAKQNFAPTRPAPSTAGTTHTKSKGS